MGQPFAAGKRAIGYCDRCGFQYLLSELRSEVKNLEETDVKACPECWDPDNPQTQLGRHYFNDPQALRNPRPTGGVAGRDLPSGYRCDFSTGTSASTPARIDGWWAKNGTVTWESSSQTLKVVSDGTSVSDPPKLTRGYNNNESNNDWLSIDASVYKFAVVMLKVNTFPAGASGWSFLGNFEWTKNTDTSGPVSLAFDGPESALSIPPFSPPKARFYNTQTSDGFLAADKDMATWHKLVFDMSDVASWTGTITGLRFALMDADGSSVDNGSYSVDYIEVVAFYNPDL